MTKPRPLGPRVEHWTPPPAPGRTPMTGRLCRLEPLRSAHAADLFAAFGGDESLWDYMANGPYRDAAAYADWIAQAAAGSDPLFYAIVDPASGRPQGVASYLRIAPEAGSIEVGNIVFAPPMQRRPIATEAMYLMMRWAFEAGYRRYEWKCNALNAPSRRAAQRLGLSYEGVFRQALVVKGRNRDTAWFAAIDSEWPALRAAFEAWLAPGNFDSAGRQIIPLGRLTRGVLVARDPSL